MGLLDPVPGAVTGNNNLFADGGGGLGNAGDLMGMLGGQLGTSRDRGAAAAQPVKSARPASAAIRRTPARAAGRVH
jgi:hypothetical protein